MRQTACNFCGSETNTLYHKLVDIRLGKAGVYQLKKCNSCGLLFLNPQPTWDELVAHYPIDYHCFFPAKFNAKSPLENWNKSFGVNRRVRLVTKGFTTGTILDIGCATGQFLFSAKCRGWKTFGVEPVESAASYAREQFGLNIFSGMLHQANFPNDFFNVITAWDVLEHTHDPRGVLQEVYRILKPGGLFVFKIPDPDSKEARLFGPFWVGYEAPQHLYAFPKKVLLEKLLELGFCGLRESSIGTDLSTLLLSISVFWGYKKVFPLERTFKWFSRSPVIKILLFPFIYSLRRLGFRSSTVYFASK